MAEERFPESCSDAGNEHFATMTSQPVLTVLLLNYSLIALENSNYKLYVKNGHRDNHLSEPEFPLRLRLRLLYLLTYTVTFGHFVCKQNTLFTCRNNNVDFVVNVALLHYIIAHFITVNSRTNLLTSVTSMPEIKLQHIISVSSEEKVCYQINVTDDRRFARAPSNCTDSATYELTEPEFEPKP